jgi:hypothetical protein
MDEDYDRYGTHHRQRNRDRRIQAWVQVLHDSEGRHQKQEESQLQEFRSMIMMIRCFIHSESTFNLRAYVALVCANIATALKLAFINPTPFLT